MSALAIAGVTAVLKNLTQNHFATPAITASLGATPGVSALPPDRAEDLHGDDDAVNWFMQRTAPNIGIQDEFYPTRNSHGDRINRSPLALDLYYLLSAYSGSDLHGEVLMGHVLQLFHENPILDRDAITGALATAAAGDAAIITALNNAAIPDHLEQIKLSIHHPDDDWLSKVWGSFNAHFRPSVVVHASVILIESAVSFQPGLPVQRYEVEAVPLTLPRIERVESATDPAARISFGDDIRIRGSNLRNDVTRARIGDIDLADGDFSALTNTGITVPGAALSALSAGVNSVQIVHDLLLGVPAVPHRGFQSNIVALILHPVLGTVTPTLAADINGRLEGQIQIDVQPPVERNQRVNLLLNETAASGDASYSFSLPPRTTDPPQSSFTFDVAGIDSGDYLIRIQVDGAASQLSIDPTTGTIDETPITLS